MLWARLSLSFPAVCLEASEILLEKISRRKNLMYFHLVNLRIFRIRKSCTFIHSLHTKEEKKTPKPGAVGAI